MKLSSSLLILLAGVIPLNAQETFGAPVAGHVFDATRNAIRPIAGSPGAAYLGATPNYRWDTASVSPNGKTALGLKRDVVHLIPDVASQGRVASLETVIATVDNIVWSMDSTTAVLFSSKSSLLQRITGLGGTPVVHPPVDLSLAGTLSGRSVSSDGRSIALSSGASGTASVYLLTDDSLPPSPVGSFGDPGVSSFSADNKSLFVFDRAVQKIVRLNLVDNTVQGSLDSGSIGEIRSLLSSPDGALLFATGAQSLSAFDLSTLQTVWSVPLDITPDSMSVLSVSPALYVLNYPRQYGSPLWLLDGRTAQVYFVPSGGAAGYASN